MFQFSSVQWFATRYDVLKATPTGPPSQRRTVVTLRTAESRSLAPPVADYKRFGPLSGCDQVEARRLLRQSLYE